MFDWQNFVVQNNLVIGLIVGSIVFLTSTIWTIKTIPSNSAPERIMGQTISAKTSRSILIVSCLALGALSIFTWRSAVVFWLAFLLIECMKWGLRRRKAKSRSSALGA